ncbi:MAG: amino acid ABC transporter permease [Rickettsiales bacterium]
MIEITIHQTQSILQTLIQWFWFIGSGTIVTLKYGISSILIGLIIAIILTIINYSQNKIINLFTKGYVSLIRGTPLILQMSIIYLGLPSVLNIKVNLFFAGVISFAINSSAYLYEIIRSGINSVNKGEIEAATALGISNKNILFYIVLPQSIKNSLPALIGELINLIKETAIISIFGGEDIMRQAQMISAQKYEYMIPLIFAGIWYYIIIICLEQIINKITKK